jgi:hypothetical protein
MLRLGFALLLCVFASQTHAQNLRQMFLDIAESTVKHQALFTYSESFGNSSKKTHPCGSRTRFASTAMRAKRRGTASGSKQPAEGSIWRFSQRTWLVSSRSIDCSFPSVPHESHATLFSQTTWLTTLRTGNSFPGRQQFAMAQFPLTWKEHYSCDCSAHTIGCGKHAKIPHPIFASTSVGNTQTIIENLRIISPSQAQVIACSFLQLRRTVCANAFHSPAISWSIVWADLVQGRSTSRFCTRSSLVAVSVILSLDPCFLRTSLHLLFMRACVCACVHSSNESFVCRKALFDGC